MPSDNPSGVGEVTGNKTNETQLAKKDSDTSLLLGLPLDILYEVINHVRASPPPIQDGHPWCLYTMLQTYNAHTGQILIQQLATQLAVISRLDSEMTLVCRAMYNLSRAQIDHERECLPGQIGVNPAAEQWRLALVTESFPQHWTWLYEVETLCPPDRVKELVIDFRVQISNTSNVYPEWAPRNSPALRPTHMLLTLMPLFLNKGLAFTSSGHVDLPDLKKVIINLYIDDIRPEMVDVQTSQPFDDIYVAWRSDDLKELFSDEGIHYMERNALDGLDWAAAVWRDMKDFIENHLRGSRAIFGQAVEELFLVFRYPEQLPIVGGWILSTDGPREAPRECRLVP